MTKIRYEVEKTEKGKEKVIIQLEGSGGNLLRGFCRTAVKLKEELKIDTNKEFLDLIDGGMSVAELEDKVNDGNELNPMELLKHLFNMMENEKKDD